MLLPRADLVERAGRPVAQNVELAVRALAEARDHEVGLEQHRAGPGAALPGRSAPDRARAEIGEEIPAEDAGHLAAAIPVASDHGTAEIVVVLENGQHETGLIAARRRIEAVAALHDPPSVVLAARAGRGLQIDLLPLVLSDVADEQGAGEPVEGEAPGIAKAERPDLRKRAGHADEGVARGHRVGRTAVDVDP